MTPMTKKLSIEQRNNLLVGNPLAAELPSLYDDTRVWVEVMAYSRHSTPGHWVPVSTFLNADRSEQRYQLKWYETEKEYYNHWSSADYRIRRAAEVRDVMSVEALEDVLAKYLEHVSLLAPNGKTESPLW
jgi:hypothetical protein